MGTVPAPHRNSPCILGMEFCRSFLWCLGPHHLYNFCIENLFGPFLRFLDLETVVLLWFLDPVTVLFLKILDPENNCPIFLIHKIPCFEKGRRGIKYGEGGGRSNSNRASLLALLLDLLEGWIILAETWCRAGAKISVWHPYPIPGIGGTWNTWCKQR